MPDRRRRVPYGRQAGACSLKVPLLSPVGGERLEGCFSLPSRLANTQPHTNEHYEYLGAVKENYERWVDWRRRRGWDVVPGSLQITKPYAPLVEHTIDEADSGIVWISLYARFTRSTPLYVGLDDFMEIREKGLRLSIPEQKDSGWVNPLVYAEERRKRQGVQLAEYRSPEWWEAEAKGEKWQPR